MKNTQTLSKLLATTIFCGAFVGAPAFAQDTDQNEPPVAGPVEAAQPDVNSMGQDTQDEDAAIIVTGSRIRQPNLESASPITVLNSQEVALTGTTRAEDLINSLPQAFAAQGGNIANGASGTATLNLRGLGSERTLVLVNGRRLVPGDPNSSAADINIIPAAIIDRVDVLTGGASSVYGADAVSGVVNFIMDTDFEGFRFDGQYSFYQHENNTRDSVINALNGRGFGFPTGNVADGGTWDATVAFGAGFDDGRGHVTAYVGYRKIDAVLQGRRDYSACNLGASTATAIDAGANSFSCGGSATAANGSFIIYDSDRPDLGGSFTSTFFQLGPDRNFIAGFTPYNFGPLNYFQRPDERYTAGLFAEYEVTEGVTPYLEFMFMDDRTVAQIAPSGDFGNTFSLNCGAPGDPTGPGRNPLLSDQQAAIVCDTENLLSDASGSVVGNTGDPPQVFIDPISGATYTRGFAQILRRNVEGGPRQDDLQHTTYRAVAGVRGDIDPVWSYDTYYQYGRNNFAETYLNDFSVTRLTRALDVITGPDGTPICRAAQTGGEDPNCVPYDIFGGGVSPAAINYLATPGLTRGIVEETVFNASVSADLGGYGFRFPWSDDGVGLAAGFEYRKEQLNFFSDTAFQTGDLAGQGAPTLPVSGSFDVKEAFAEVRIPVISDSFIDEFTITGAYRYSDYQNSAGGGFNTDTYKIEAELAPVDDIRFRGSYNRAVRAPTVQDLFAPNRVVLDASTDPCAGFVITAADTGCLAQGLSVGQFVALNPANQYNGLIGGNPDLNPEIADTWTVGVVIQPRWIPRLAISVDAFDIELDGAIGGIGADTILNVCTDTADPFFCGLINRDQFGSLWRSNNGFVIDTTQNIGGLSTRGVDINGSYSMSIGSMGSLGFNFVGTYLDELVTDTGVAGSFDCAGLYGNVCGTPNPEWRHQARISWTGPDGIGLSLRWRYFGSVTLDAAEDDPNLSNPGIAARPELARIDDQSYFDLALTFRVSDNYGFRLGVNNILDRDPPLTASQACPPGPCNGNTWAQVYDALGRYVFAGVTLDF